MRPYAQIKGDLDRANKQVKLAEERRNVFRRELQALSRGITFADKAA